MGFYATSYKSEEYEKFCNVVTRVLSPKILLIFLECSDTVGYSFCINAETSASLSPSRYKQQ